MDDFLNLIDDVSTNTKKQIPLSDEEIAQYKETRLANEKRLKENKLIEAQKISDKNKLLEKLGITEEEVKLLLG